LRGKVAAVTFIYTLCGDTCPVLTPTMALVAGPPWARFRTKGCIRFHHNSPRARHPGHAQGGVLRVQYLGLRFDPEEFRRDIVSLIEEQ
jgi:hypothetical protein